MSSPLVFTVNLTDNRIVDNEDNEVPVGNIIYCLGDLFRVTDNGVSHYTGKIYNTWYMQGKHIRSLNELAFADTHKLDVETMPGAQQHLFR